MFDKLFEVALVVIAYFLGAYSAADPAKMAGWIEYHQGKVECIEVFDKVECRLKESGDD